MKNLENQKTKNKKEYFIPMEVTTESIKALGIKGEDITWKKIGGRLVRVVMIPASKEQYYEYMRPLWREVKQVQRERERRYISIDSLSSDYSYEIADSLDMEEDLMKRELLEALRRELDVLEEIDRKIMELFGEGYSESAIGKEIGMSQKGVNKRKKKLFARLKEKLSSYR